MDPMAEYAPVDDSIQAGWQQREDQRPAEAFHRCLHHQILLMAAPCSIWIPCHSMLLNNQTSNLGQRAFHSA